MLVKYHIIINSIHSFGMLLRVLTLIWRKNVGLPLQPTSKLFRTTNEWEFHPSLNIMLVYI